jgi:hypothetical protein
MTYGLDQKEMTAMLYAGIATAAAGWGLGMAPGYGTFPMPVQFGLAGMLGFYISKLYERSQEQ